MVAKFNDRCKITALGNQLIFAASGNTGYGPTDGRPAIWDCESSENCHECDRKIVGRAREGRVGHDVYGERGDVGRPDDAPDGKRGAKLIATVFECNRNITPTLSIVSSIRRRKKKLFS
jgi:hypothetical protein